jgi:hypothetical protein
VEDPVTQESKTNRYRYHYEIVSCINIPVFMDDIGKTGCWCKGNQVLTSITENPGKEKTQRNNSPEVLLSYFRINKKGRQDNCPRPKDEIIDYIPGNNNGRLREVMPKSAKVQEINKITEQDDCHECDDNDYLVTPFFDPVQC